MPADVFAKTVRDRWLGWTIAVGAVASFVLLGMAAYEGLDLAVLDSFPPAYRSLLGLPEGADAGALAISAIYGSYGALTFAAMALAMGAAGIAGEERAGTLGLLLGNPKSRRHVLVSKMAALALLSIVSTLSLWGLAIGSASVLDVALGELDVAALSVHMLANTLFYGLLASALGAVTGNRGGAAGIATGVLVVGFLGAGLMPLLEGGEDWVRLFPWHYFSGSEPLANGVDWGHVGLLAGASALFAAIAVVGLERRDLKGRSVGVTLVDRLRAFPMTRRAADLLAGTARVSSIWAKTASEHQVSLLSACAYMLLVQMMLGGFWLAIPEETIAIFAQMPESLGVMFELFGGGDVTTAAGWFQIETFGMMAPIMISIVTISIGANAVAGEEGRRTMGLLLANPVSRSRLVAEKVFTMVVYASIVGVVAFVGTMLGVLIGDMGLAWRNVAATCFLLTLVGLVSGALALAVGAATGRKGAAVFGSAGFLVATHVLNSLGEISDAWTGAAALSPFRYYLGGDPLNSGLAWGDAAVLAALAVALFASAFPLFWRRDIVERD